MLKKINRLFVMLYCSMQTFLYRAKQTLTSGVRSFAVGEAGAVDIVAIVVLIGIAVVLAVLFRNRIQSLLETLFGNIDSSAASAVAAG